MSTDDRKVGFYGIELKKYKKHEIYFDKDLFKSLLEYIDGLNEKEKVIRIEKYKKAVSIEKIEFEDKTKKIDGEDFSYEIGKITFKSCKYNHNPKYMSSVDGTERKSDKKDYEGEKEKTHLCIRIDECEAKAVLEERRSGVTINGIIDYLNKKMDKYLEIMQLRQDFKIIQSIIPVSGFLEQLSEMKELKIAEIYTYKKLLGSEGLNFMDREDSSMKDNLIIKATAKRGQGMLRRTMEKAYSSLVNGENKISRIRIYGNNSDKNLVKIDSEVIKRLDYIKAELDLDGTVNSVSIFVKMIQFLEEDDE